MVLRQPMTKLALLLAKEVATASYPCDPCLLAHLTRLCPYGCFRQPQAPDGLTCTIRSRWKNANDNNEHQRYGNSSKVWKENMEATHQWNTRRNNDELQRTRQRR
ncbi:hypothetical protein IWZ00DRAFT_516194 [Phyllosticta capitalensis]